MDGRPDVTRQHLENAGVVVGYEVEKPHAGGNGSFESSESTTSETGGDSVEIDGWSTGRASMRTQVEYRGCVDEHPKTP